MDRTSTALLANIKRIAIAPVSQRLFTDEDFLNFANDCQEQFIIEQLMKVREDFFVTTVIMAVDGKRYTIPQRAIGLRIRLVELVSASDNELFLKALSRDEDYVFEDNELVLREEPPTNSALKLQYFRRPSRIVVTSRCAQVTAVVGQVVTVSDVPDNIEVDSVVDLVSQLPPFKTLGDDLTVSGIAGNDLTLVGDVSQLTAGDWVALAEETPIPQLFVELHALLAQHAKMEIFDSIGNEQGYTRAAAKFNLLKDSLFSLTQDRDQNSAKRATQRKNPLWQNW